MYYLSEKSAPCEHSEEVTRIREIRQSCHNMNHFYIVYYTVYKPMTDGWSDVGLSGANCIVVDVDCVCVVAVPDYEVVRVRRSARPRADTHNLQLRAFGRDLALALRPADGLFRQPLRFWTAEANSSGHVLYDPLPHVSTTQPSVPVGVIKNLRFNL
jgi:hypothetical protein